MLSTDDPLGRFGCSNIQARTSAFEGKAARERGERARSVDFLLQITVDFPRALEAMGQTAQQPVLPGRKRRQIHSYCSYGLDQQPRMFTSQRLGIEGTQSIVEIIIGQDDSACTIVTDRNPQCR